MGMRMRGFYTLAEKCQTTTTDGEASRPFYLAKPEKYGRHPTGFEARKAFMVAFDRTLEGASEGRIKQAWHNYNRPLKRLKVVRCVDIKRREHATKT